MNNDKVVTTGQFYDFVKLADERLDNLELKIPKHQALTLLKGKWTNNFGDANYPYQYRLTVDGITTASRADVVLDAASVAVASDCGVCAVSETVANTVIFKSRTAPTADLTGFLYITKATAMSGT